MSSSQMTLPTQDSTTRKDENIRALSSIWTHDLSIQAIKAYALDSEATGTGQFNTPFTKIHHMKRKKQTTLNYLGLVTTNAGNKLYFYSYRKPTTTDHIINYDSCHATEHKIRRMLLNIPN
jgi:hypothetical protein